MTDRPIPFSGPMVRALVEERKTQTRRVLTSARVFATPETPAFTLRGSELARAMQNANRFRRLDGDGWFWEADAFAWQAPALRTGWMAHVGYAPGDRLWVREAWRTFASLDAVKPRDLLVPGESGAGLMYEVDGQGLAVSAAGSRSMRPRENRRAFGKLRPSMFMPRWASRLTLVVTEVRVQRLQDISEADAMDEGIRPAPDGTFRDGLDERQHETAVEAYRSLWDHLNGKRDFGWDTNPWVSATTFTVHHQNIDALGAKEAA